MQRRDEKGGKGRVAMVVVAGKRRWVAMIGDVDREEKVGGRDRGRG